MRSACAFGAVVFALSMMACSSDDTGGGEDPPAEGCEPSSTVCAGDDVNICNLAGTSYVFSRACGPVGTCVAGVCVGGDEGEGEGGDGGDEGVDPSGEGEGGGGDAGEGEGDGGDGGEGEGEAVAGEGEGEGVQGEGEGEGEGDGGDEGAGEGEGGDGGDEGGGEGEGEVEPPECEENRDCPGRQLCDQELLECEEGAGCEGDIDCLDDRRCYDGLCNDPCVENADCPGSRSCQDGICPEPAICFGPDDCNQGRICRAGVCEQGCEAPGDCPGRQQCDVDAGRCIEPEVCEENADCVGERLCHVARCVPPCDDDGDCPGTRHCNPDRRLCLEPAFCVVPADCDPGRRCNRGTCRGVCEGPDDCPGNQRCNAGQGLCEEAGACNDDDDCLGARVCLGERCRPSCVQDGCEGQQVCDEGDGHCQEPEVCLGNIDCVGDRVCGPGGDCYDRGCAGHADCEGGDDCVDHLCAAPLGPACAADVDCEGDRVCAPAGVCVLGGPCGDDAECPGAAGVCGAGACVQCVADDDCAVTEGCADGRCVYHGGCEQDLDCRGDRTCEDLDCAAADCEADRFDGGDELPVLWTATYTGLRLCDGDEDRYRTTVLPDQGLIVTLRHDGGDLSLELFDAANPFEPLAAADGPWGLEQLSVPPSPAPLELEISVRGGMGASPDYTLDLRSAGEGVCARDAFEGLLGNDQRARASVIGLGDFALEICPADVDWLAVDLVAGSRLDVAAEAAQGNDGLSLSLHAPNGELLEEGEDSPFGLAAATDARLPGRYLIRVALDDDEAQASVRLQVSVLASNNSESDACRHVPELAPGEPVRWAPGAAVHRFELSCGDPFAPDFAATFELPQQAVVTLSAVGATAVALRTECAARPSERGCVEDPDPVLGPIPLDAGTYTIIAHSFDGRPPTLDLDVAIFCGVDGDCPDDDVCDGGQCHAPCQGDDDCTGAQRCGDGGHCDEPDVCAEDDDCVGLRECRYDGACFVADCDLHADCEGACVDRVCADAAPRACSEDGDCDAGLVCAPVGACVRADPCGDNDDCPAGAPICDGGECVVCRGGQGCSAAEACGGGRCRFVGFCEEDGDCPGTRTCDGGDCVAGGDCDGDRYDADDGPFRVLGLRTYGGLVRCDGTTDVYSTNLPAGQALRATLVHDPAVGDLSLALELPGPPPEELASSDQPHGVEVVTVGPFPDDQDLNVVVGGRRGFDVPYSVSLRRADPDECPADGHEGLLGNDSLARATGVRVGQVEHEICEGDEDWFAISLQAGTALTATSAVAGPAGDLLVSIVDSEGGGLADGEPGPDGVQARAIAETPGSYGIRVRAANDAVRAEATLDVVAAPAPNASALACAHATEVILDGPAVQLGPGPAVERFAVPCGLGMPGLSADFLWTLDLARDETVDIRARDAEAVLVRSACDDAGSDVTCGLPGSPEIEELELEAGRYWVIVQTTGGLRPSVRVVRSE